MCCLNSRNGSGKKLPCGVNAHAKDTANSYHPYNRDKSNVVAAGTPHHVSENDGRDRGSDLGHGIPRARNHSGKTDAYVHTHGPTGLCLAKTLADYEINNIAGGPLPEFCYNSDYAQRALARVRVAPSTLP